MLDKNICDTLIHTVTNILYALFLFSVQLLEIELSSTFSKRAEAYSSRAVSVWWKRLMLPGGTPLHSPIRHP